MGQPKSRLLPVGRGLLPDPSQTGQIPRVCLTMPGSALAQDSLEAVADAHLLRCGAPSEKPAPARVLGAQTADHLTFDRYVNNFAQNSNCKPENISWPPRAHFGASLALGSKVL